MYRRLCAVILVATAVGMSPAFAGTITSDASKFVHDLGDQAISALSQKQDGPAEREQKFEKILNQFFDVPVIARSALGRHWRKASVEQRKDYVTLVGKYIARSYAVKLGGHTGEQLRVLSERALSNKRDVMVETRIERTKGPPIKVDWRVRTRKDSKAIIDVMVEGVSLVVAQRNEFASVVRRNGLNGLLDALRKHTQKASTAN